LQREIEQLARQLERLQAADAGQSTQKAANRLDAGDSQQPDSQRRPAPSNVVQKAEQDLAEAANQLAQRRQQAEDDLAVEFVRRFQAELGKMVERQQRVLEQTVQLDSERRPNEPLGDAQRQAADKLGNEERQLATSARDHGELLHGLAAVRIGLEQAESRLASAAKFLDNGDTGATAQQAERHALERLEGMLEAFAQTATEAGQNPPPAGGTGAPPGEQPQRRPTFELLEVKMLRMLQVDVNERTRTYQERRSAATELPQAEQADLLREGRELQAEQGRLAELVQEMLTRDNGE
jgi:hypothetical protein